MPTFAYEAMNSSGQEVKDEVEATTRKRRSPRFAGRALSPPRSAKKPPRRRVKKKGRRRRRLTTLHPSGRCRSPSAGCRGSSSSTSPGSFPRSRTPACRFCAACRSWNSSNSPACSRPSSAALRTKLKAAEPSPTPWPNSPRLRQALRQHDQRRRGGRRAGYHRTWPSPPAKYLKLSNTRNRAKQRTG